MTREKGIELLVLVEMENYLTDLLGVKDPS